MPVPYQNISDSTSYAIFHTESGGIWKVVEEPAIYRFYKYNREEEDEFEYDGYIYQLKKRESLKDVYDRYLLEEYS